MNDAPVSLDFPLEPALAFMQKVWHLNHALERLSSAMEKELGVTAQQRFLLRCVGAYPGISAGQLGVILHVDPGTVSATLRRLEARDLIERYKDPRDGRRVFLGLTSKGRALDVPLADSVEGAAEELLRSVPPEDVQRVHLTLDRLIASLEARTDR
jgi:DNA-binding MarR family transcriptional regulator